MAALLPAQEGRTERVYTYDGAGQRAGSATISASAGTGSSSRTVRTQNLNGRSVPLQSVQEKVIEDRPGYRVVERTVQLYGQDGRPTSRQKVRIETREEGAGRQSTTTTVYETDVNGSFQIRERQRSRAVTRDDVTDTTTEVERPTISGAVQLVEKRVTHEVEHEDAGKRDETVYQRDEDGNFRPAARETTETVRGESRETSTVTRYNTVNFSGAMEFAGQSVTELERRPDGSQVKVISRYGAATPGRPIPSSDREARLREQEIVERQVQRDGTVVETTSVRHGSISDRGELGPPQKVTEVICTGNCLEPPAPAGGEKEQDPKTEKK